MRGYPETTRIRPSGTGDRVIDGSQVYRIGDLAQIYGVSDSSIRAYAHPMGRYPEKLAQSIISSPVWAKADVWMHKGIALPTPLDLGKSTLLPTGQVRGLLGMADSTITEAGAKGLLRVHRVDGRVYFDPQGVCEVLGHPLYDFPMRHNDPAFDHPDVVKAAKITRSPSLQIEDLSSQLQAIMDRLDAMNEVIEIRTGRGTDMRDAIITRLDTMNEMIDTRTEKGLFLREAAIQRLDRIGAMLDNRWECPEGAHHDEKEITDADRQ